jgi:hypothetical protein
MELDSSNSESFYCLAYALSSQELFNDALEVCRRGLLKNPNDHV